MRNSDKNGFIQILKENRMDLSDFRSSEEILEGNDAFRIELKNSPFYFIARTNNNNIFEHDCIFVTYAKSFPLSKFLPDGFSEWSNIGVIYDYFSHWIDYHVNNYLADKHVPDMWVRLNSEYSTEVDPLNSKMDIPFNEMEKIQLKAALVEFQRLLIKEFKPSVEKIETIDKNIYYLSTKLDQLHKIDWKGIAISTIINIMVALSLNNQQGKMILEWFKQSVLNVIFQLTR